MVTLRACSIGRTPSPCVIFLSMMITDVCAPRGVPCTVMRISQDKVHWYAADLNVVDCAEKSATTGSRWTTRTQPLVHTGCVERLPVNHVSCGNGGNALYTGAEAILVVPWTLLCSNCAFKQDRLCSNTLRVGTMCGSVGVHVSVHTYLPCVLHESTV